MSEPRFINSIKNAFDILEYIIEENGADFAELATEHQMPKSTIHGYLASLELCGYLVNENGRYNASTKIIYNGSRTQLNIPAYKKGHSEMCRLAAETGEYVTLMIEEKGLGAIIAQEVGQDASHASMNRPGRRTNLHASAPGKAILAFQSKERQEEIIEEWGLPAWTQNTVTNIEVLEEEFERIRNQGYAVDKEEQMMGLQGVGVPIRGIENSVNAAISLYGPSNRIDQWFEKATAMVLETANEIELAVNYS